MDLATELSNKTNYISKSPHVSSQRAYEMAEAN